MIIFGSRTSNIGNLEIPNSKCDYCEQNSRHRISVFGKYVHIFWIPIFPIGKKAIAECTHCKRTIEEREFSPVLKQGYQKNKSQVKRPFWHSLGLWLISLLVTLIAVISVIAITTERDPRSDLLQKDIKAMTANPTMETDSLSYIIKQSFDNLATTDINPSNFKYLTKVQDNKVLFLIKIPKLKKVKKEERNEILEIIEMITNTLDNLKGKEKYIGVQGAITMMLIKTPTYEKNSKLASIRKLYEFYGSKPE